MLRRIGWWALGGLVVAFIWVLVFYFLGPSRGQYPSQAAVLNYLGHSAILRVTIPWVEALHRVPITWYQSLVLNAASYALIGMVVELVLMALHPLFPKRGAPNVASN